MTEQQTALCQRDDGSYTAGHAWQYSKLPRSGEPVRYCDRCDRAEVYYLDDLLLEQEMAGDV
jgi:hypothetical protein